MRGSTLFDIGAYSLLIHLFLANITVATNDYTGILLAANIFLAISICAFVKLAIDRFRA